jgi:PhzF family phenazine biosynthesis protein
MPAAPAGPRVLVVDAFASAPFTGNPAAVCLPQGDAPPSDAAMQALAGQMNLAETAYPHPVGDGWRLRWFTPVREVPLCGHATLASAHALWETGLAPNAPIVFHTLGGRLEVSRDGADISMDFPAVHVTAAPVPEGAEDAVGGRVREAGTASVGLVLVLDGADEVRRIVPDPARIGRLHPFAVLVTAPGGPADDADVVSRYFAPNAGIPEDPVTGSAHCALATFWCPRLGRPSLRCRQLSPRGGDVAVRLDGDRVHLGGRARTVLDGRLVAPLPTG